VRQVADARGRPLALPDRVARVVSLVPSLTEWLVVAGVGERLVGVTDWCVEPAEVVARLPKVRGTKNPDLGEIRALEPDRRGRDASFLVQTHGDALLLHRGEWFDTDLWRFDELAQAALKAQDWAGEAFLRPVGGGALPPAPATRPTMSSPSG